MQKYAKVLLATKSFNTFLQTFFYIFIISKVLNTLIFTQLVVKKIFLSPNPRSLAGLSEFKILNLALKTKKKATF